MLFDFTFWHYVSLFYEIFVDFPMFYTIFDTYWRVKGGGGGRQMVTSHRGTPPPPP